MSEMNIPEEWKLVPVEPTREMLEARWARLGDDWSPQERWEAMLAAAPTPPAQEDEPVAWLVPRILEGTTLTHKAELLIGMVAWEASIFCDTRNQARVDKNGNKFYPRPLYTHPGSGLRKAAEEALEALCNTEQFWLQEDDQKAINTAAKNLRAALEGK